MVHWEQISAQAPQVASRSCGPQPLTILPFFLSATLLCSVPIHPSAPVSTIAVGLHLTALLCLSPSLRPGMDKEVLGILVSYKVKVNLVVSRGG